MQLSETIYNNLILLFTGTTQTNTPVNSHWLLRTRLLCILRTFVSITAFMLAYDCTRYDSILRRIVTPIISIIFSELYIIYYTIYRVIMGNKCY
jgi:hypothetical protein